MDKEAWKRIGRCVFFVAVMFPALLLLDSYIVPKPQEMTLKYQQTKDAIYFMICVLVIFGILFLYYMEFVWAQQDKRRKNREMLARFANEKLKESGHETK